MEVILICLVIAAVVAFIVTGVMKAQLKTVRRQHAAGSYVVNGSFRLHRSHDLYLYRNLSRRPRNNSK